MAEPQLNTWVAIIEALGTSGVAGSIAAIVTGKYSGRNKQQAATAEVVTAKTEERSLAEEVVWLRQQVITWQERANQAENK